MWRARDDGREEASFFGALEERCEVGESLRPEFRGGKAETHALLGVRPGRGGRAATQSRTALGLL